jgi:hypothetical protein
MDKPAPPRCCGLVVLELLILTVEILLLPRNRGTGAPPGLVPGCRAFVGVVVLFIAVVVLQGDIVSTDDGGDDLVPPSLFIPTTPPIRFFFDPLDLDDGVRGDDDDDLSTILHFWMPTNVCQLVQSKERNTCRSCSCLSDEAVAIG